MEEKKLSMKQNVIYNTIGSFFYLACQWLITILVVHLGDFKMAGDLTIAISLSNTFSTIANFGMKNYQVSDTKNQYSASEYVSTRVVTCAVAIIIAVVFLGMNGHYTKAQCAVIFTYIVYRVIEAFVDVIQGIQQKAYRMDYIGISMIFRGIGTVLGFVLGLVGFKSLVWANLWMILLTLLVVVLYDMPKVFHLVKIKIVLKRNIWNILWACIPLMITMFLTSSIVTIPRYYLEKMCGREIAGYYGSVATPTVIIQSLCIMIYTPITPIVAESYLDRRKKQYYGIIFKTIAVMLGVSVVMCIGAALLGKWGLTILFGQEIQKYAYLFTPIVLTTIMMAFVYFFNMILTVSRNIKAIVIANAAAVGAIYMVVKPFIRKYNMDGVNYCLYLGLMLAIAIMVLVWIKDIRNHFKEKNND